MESTEELLSCSLDAWMFCDKCELPVLVDFDLAYFYHFDAMYTLADATWKLPCMIAIDTCPLVDKLGFAKDPQLPYLRSEDTSHTSRIWMDSAVHGSDSGAHDEWNRYGYIFSFRDRSTTVQHVQRRCPEYLDYIVEFRLCRHIRGSEFTYLSLTCSQRSPHNCNYDLTDFNQLAKGYDDFFLFNKDCHTTRYDQALTDEMYSVKFPLETTCRRNGVPDFTQFQAHLICGTLEKLRPTWACTIYTRRVKPGAVLVCECNFNCETAFKENINRLVDLTYERRWRLFQRDYGARKGGLCQVHDWVATYCCDSRGDTDCVRKFCLNEMAILPFELMAWTCCYHHCPCKFYHSDDDEDPQQLEAGTKS